MSYAERRNGKLTGRQVVDAVYKQPEGGTMRWHQAFRISKAEADGNEAYFRATGEKPPHMMKVSSQSFAAVVERFKLRHTTWCADRHNTQRLEFALDHLGKLDVAMIRTAQLEKYVDTIRARCGRGAEPPANNTVNNYLIAVGKILRYAHKLDLIPGLPSMPRAEATGKKRAAVSWVMENAICQRLVSEGHEVQSFLIRILAASGMRRGELYALRPEQIETPDQIENTGWELKEEQTKTNAARWIPMQPEAAKKLRTLIASKRLPSAAHLSDAFKRTAKALGDTDDLSLHCLRHTFATRLEDTGADTLIIAKLLGHSAGLMTARYFKPSHERLFEVAKKVHTGLGEMVKTGEVVQLKDQQNRALSA